LVPHCKNGETRHIPLNDAAIAALRAAQAVGSGIPYIFLSATGTRLSSPRFWFDAAVKDAELANFTWHSLRHTFASRLVMSGVDLRTVQELMGHKTIQMTVRYAHLAPEHRLAAVQRLCNTEGVHKQANDTRSDTVANADFRQGSRDRPQTIDYTAVQ
jgi:site-specific recombinase XerD